MKKRRFLVIEANAAGEKEISRRKKIAEQFGKIRTKSEVKAYLASIGERETLSVQRGTFFVEITASDNAYAVMNQILK